MLPLVRHAGTDGGGVEMYKPQYRPQVTAAERLEREREKDRYEEEVLLAHDFLKAYPEMSYGEALRHAFAKLRKEGKR